MSASIAEIRDSFFQECTSHLEALQDGLSEIENGTANEETIHEVFRAVHSIKGGAAAFDIVTLVKLAHRFETALEAVRSKQATPDKKAVKLFLRACDLLGDLLRLAGTENTEEPEGFRTCLSELDAYIQNNAEFPVKSKSTEKAASNAQDREITSVGIQQAEPIFDIIFEPNSEIFPSGNEPLYVLKSLYELGHVTVTCDTSKIPCLSDLNPETSYLSWKVELLTTCDLDEVREVFDFVEDLCVLNISERQQAHSHTPNLDLRSNRVTEPDSNAEQQPAEPFQITQPDALSRQSSVKASAEKARFESRPPEEITAPAAKPTVRVDLDRVDLLVNQIGELVINQAVLAQSIATTGLNKDASIFAALEDFSQLASDLQDSVMMIRAQPVKTLFQRMARVVRETSRTTQKDVRLLTEGESTEIDKTVIEGLFDPLTHIIRNAIDHGIECPAERSECGKPEIGEIHLTARHKSGRVTIEISDDGRGINRSEILRKAKETGLVDQSAKLSISEVDNLLFLPGFSSSNSISNVSGRGVGLDIVRNSIAAMGGRIFVTTTEMKGTVFNIDLPLTLAVQDGLVVEVSHNTHVIPLSNIVETLILKNSDIHLFGSSTKMIKIRDKFLPIIDLGAALGYRKRKSHFDGCIVLLIAQEENYFALIVDTIIEQRQVVIKALQNNIGTCPGVSGATILGDGKIALILDPIDIVKTTAPQNRFRKEEFSLAG